MKIAWDKPAAAVDWLKAIEERFAVLAAQPHAGDGKILPSGNEARVVPFGNYVIYFKPVSDGVTILRVWHGARGRDPRI